MHMEDSGRRFCGRAISAPGAYRLWIPGRADMPSYDECDELSADLVFFAIAFSGKSDAKPMSFADWAKRVNKVVQRRLPEEASYQENREWALHGRVARMRLTAEMVSLHLDQPKAIPVDVDKARPETKTYLLYASEVAGAVRRVVAWLHHVSDLDLEIHEDEVVRLFLDDASSVKVVVRGKPSGGGATFYRHRRPYPIAIDRILRRYLLDLP